MESDGLPESGRWSSERGETKAARVTGHSTRAERTAERDSFRNLQGPFPSLVLSSGLILRTRGLKQNYQEGGERTIPKVP